jgi:hypothetical protein
VSADKVYKLARSAEPQMVIELVARCYLTDFCELLKVIVDILNGADSLDSANPVKYDADPAFNDSKQVISKGYADVRLCSKSNNKRQ